MPVKKKVAVTAGDLVENVEQLAGRGDARRVCLIQEEKRLLEIPLTVGGPASPAAVLAALNVFATLVTECAIEGEKADDSVKEYDPHVMLF